VLVLDVRAHELRDLREFKGRIAVLDAFLEHSIGGQEAEDLLKLLHILDLRMLGNLPCVQRTVLPEDVRHLIVRDRVHGLWHPLLQPHRHHLSHHEREGALVRRTNYLLLLLFLWLLLLLHDFS